MTMLPMMGGGMFGGLARLANPPLVQPEEQQSGGLLGGLFGGGKPNWKNAAIGALSGYMAARGNPIGGMGLQYLMHQRGQKREDEQYQRRQADEWNMWQRKQEYERANPAPVQPTQTDRYLSEYLDPNTDKTRKAALGQILFPPVMSTVNGMPAIIDRAQMVSGAAGGNPLDAQPTVEDGFAYTPGPGGRANQNNWKPQGGPRPVGVGGFPGSY